MNSSSEKTKMLRFTNTDVTVHQKETCYQGFFKMDNYQLSHQLFNGQQSTVLSREIFERGAAVVLIPYDSKTDQLVLLEQFRPGAIGYGETPWLLEFVAGMFESHEMPIDVAIREAQEEAGLVIEHQKTEKVMEYLSSPGGMSEVIHLYVADVNATLAKGVHGLPEEGEDILVHTLTREEAMALLAQGKITNAATIIGLQWLQSNYQRLQALW